MNELKRCRWCNLKNPIYIKYHDEEWGVPNFDEHYLFEMLILESFQAGLSWECVLNKREAFRKAFDGFNAEKIAIYDDDKIAELQNNKDIIRNKLKIRAAVNNAKIFLEIPFYILCSDYWACFIGVCYGNTVCAFSCTSRLEVQISIISNKISK